jgi:hypothetical protein
MMKFPGDIRSAFFTWGAANIVGLSVPPLILFLVPSLSAVSGLLSTTLIVSLPLSFAQWAALRRNLPVSGFWIFSMPLSILVFVLIIRQIPEYYWGFLGTETLPVLTIFGMGIGFLIGLPQWLMLRKVCERASLWLLGSTLGIGLGAGILLATDLVNYSGIAGYILVALFYIGATGLILSILLLESNRSESLAMNADQT